MSARVQAKVASSVSRAGSGEDGVGMLTVVRGLRGEDFGRIPSG